MLWNVENSNLFTAIANEYEDLVDNKLSNEKLLKMQEETLKQFFGEEKLKKE